MGRIKIGVLDEDGLYVEKLSAYLNRFDKGIWNVSGFTKENTLDKYIRERGINVLMATGRDRLMQYKAKFPEVYMILLADEMNAGMMKGINSIYRYQSAKVIGQTVKDIVDGLGMVKQYSKKSVAVYSPVGRCGKTTMMKSFVKKNIEGRWLYIGMEDYATLSEGDSYAADDFLYYILERREDAVCRILENAMGFIPSPFSPFDTRQIGREDIEWFLKIFESSTAYGGVIFDIGTGILQSLNVLLQFDILIVPYISDEASRNKIQMFEKLVKADDMNELTDRLFYLNMDTADPLTEFGMLVNGKSLKQKV